MDHPHETQQKVFKNLINKGQNTEWGKKYAYDSIQSVSDFQSRVPVSPYETLFPFIERMLKGETNVLWPGKITSFSKSSGTTNDRSKFIPVSKESLKECHYKGGKDLVAVYVHNFPQTRMFSGKSLAIGGSLTQNPYNSGSVCGDISAVIMAKLPVWAQYVRTPSIKTALMSEWEAKIERIARESMQENVTNLAGVPTWTIVLIEKILQLTGKKNILEVWPKLEAFFHGAVAFHPYRDMFKKLIPSSSFNYIETYNASEGFFGIQDRLNSEDMLLMLDYGIFYEFIPLEEEQNEFPQALTLDQVELNKTYALIISTNGGLWRYKIGDTIKFTSLNPFRIKISGRTKHFINAFGEELMIENAESAIAKACRETDSVLSDFTAAPVYFGTSNKGCHEWIIEFETPPADIEKFTVLLDQYLKEANSDYDAKRYKDLALQMPFVHQAAPGTFYKWMKKRGKLGGQNKVPRLSNNREYIDDILADLVSPEQASL